MKKYTASISNGQCSFPSRSLKTFSKCPQGAAALPLDRCPMRCPLCRGIGQQRVSAETFFTVAAHVFCDTSGK